MAIIKKPISEQIYEELKEDILCHRIGFGEKVANRDLQERFGVSSTPIRDAVRHLFLDGFIDKITNVGAHVVDFDLNAAKELNEVVSLLSVEAVRISAEKADRKEVTDLLKREISHQSKCTTNDEYFEYDNNFHRIFFSYSYNSRLCKLYDQYSMLQYVIIRYYYKTLDTDKHHSIMEHQNICSAYNSGHITQAQESMAKHYARALDIIEGLFKN